MEQLTNRQLQSINTKKRIKDAASVCFAKKGINGTLITDITKEAGVSPGTFYHYFKNKEELIINQFYPYDMGFPEYLNQLFSGDDSVEKLVRFSHHFSRDAYNRLTRAASLEYLKVRVSITLEELWPKNRPYFLVLCTLIIEGQLKCQLRHDLSPEDMADMVMVLTRGFNFDWASRDGGYDLKERIDTAVPLLLDSLRFGRGEDGPYDGTDFTLPDQLVPALYQNEVEELRRRCVEYLKSI